jgi:peptidoglycan hydrolase CwlO-like protein
MKTLKALAALWLTKTGNDVGFAMKSLKTKKVFNVISKTPSGSKFVVVLTHDAKGNKVASGGEFIVSGDEARYELFSANVGRIAEIEAQITKLETQRDNLEKEIDELSGQLADLQEDAV